MRRVRLPTGFRYYRLAGGAAIFALLNSQFPVAQWDTPLHRNPRRSWSTSTGASLSLEGHAEYIGCRSNELEEEVSWWINGQPQLRLDLGKLQYGESGQLFSGTEYWFWVNKLGDPRTDDSAFQVLVAWRF